MMTAPRDDFLFDAVTPADRVALFDLIRDELCSRAIGVAPDIVRRLALIGTQHLAGDAGARVLFRGPGGAGKSFLARTLAEILDLPVLLINSGLIAEMNWSGFDIADAVAGMLGTLRGKHPSTTAHIAARAIVIIEDLDQARLGSRWGSASSTLDYRAGKQNGLVSLVKGDPIPGDERFGPTKTWSAERALIIVNARFDGLRAPAAADDISDWGVLPELAQYLAAAHTFVLTPPAGEALERILESTIPILAKRFASFGFVLHVAPQTISYLVRALSARGSGGGALEARAILEQAASVLLLDALESPAEGEVVTLAPDHVVAPPVARGMWRE